MNTINVSDLLLNESEARQARIRKQRLGKSFSAPKSSIEGAAATLAMGLSTPEQAAASVSKGSLNAAIQSEVDAAKRFHRAKSHRERAEIVKRDPSLAKFMKETSGKQQDIDYMGNPQIGPTVTQKMQATPGTIENIMAQLDANDPAMKDPKARARMKKRLTDYAKALQDEYGKLAEESKRRGGVSGYVDPINDVALQLDDTPARGLVNPEYTGARQFLGWYEKMFPEAASGPFNTSSMSIADVERMRDNSLLEAASRLYQVDNPSLSKAFARQWAGAPAPEQPNGFEQFKQYLGELPDKIISPLAGMVDQRASSAQELGALSQQPDASLLSQFFSPVLGGAKSLVGVPSALTGLGANVGELAVDQVKRGINKMAGGNYEGGLDSNTFDTTYVGPGGQRLPGLDITPMDILKGMFVDPVVNTFNQVTGREAFNPATLTENAFNAAQAGMMAKGLAQGLGKFFKGRTSGAPDVGAGQTAQAAPYDLNDSWLHDWLRGMLQDEPGIVRAPGTSAPQAGPQMNRPAALNAPSGEAGIVRAIVRASEPSPVPAGAVPYSQYWKPTGAMEGQPVQRTPWSANLSSGNPLGMDLTAKPNPAEMFNTPKGADAGSILGRVYDDAFNELAVGDPRLTAADIRPDPTKKKGGQRAVSKGGIVNDISQRGFWRQVVHGPDGRTSTRFDAEGKPVGENYGSEPTTSLKGQVDSLNERTANLTVVDEMARDYISREVDAMRQRLASGGTPEGVESSYKIVREQVRKMAEKAASLNNDIADMPYKVYKIMRRDMEDVSTGVSTASADPATAQIEGLADQLRQTIVPGDEMRSIAKRLMQHVSEHGEGTYVEVRAASDIMRALNFVDPELARKFNIWAAEKGITSPTGGVAQGVSTWALDELIKTGSVPDNLRWGSDFRTKGAVPSESTVKAAESYARAELESNPDLVPTVETPEARQAAIDALNEQIDEMETAAGQLKEQLDAGQFGPDGWDNYRELYDSAVKAIEDARKQLDEMGAAPEGGNLPPTLKAEFDASGVQQIGGAVPGMAMLAGSGVVGVVGYIKENMWDNLSDDNKLAVQMSVAALLAGRVMRMVGNKAIDGGKVASAHDSTKNVRQMLREIGMDDGDIDIVLDTAYARAGIAQAARPTTAMPWDYLTDVEKAEVAAPMMAAAKASGIANAAPHAFGAGAMTVSRTWNRMLTDPVVRKFVDLTESEYKYNNWTQTKYKLAMDALKPVYDLETGSGMKGLSEYVGKYLDKTQLDPAQSAAMLNEVSSKYGIDGVNAVIQASDNVRQFLQNVYDETVNAREAAAAKWGYRPDDIGYTPGYWPHSHMFGMARRIAGLDLTGIGDPNSRIESPFNPTASKGRPSPGPTKKRSGQGEASYDAARVLRGYIEEMGREVAFSNDAAKFKYISALINKKDAESFLNELYRISPSKHFTKKGRISDVAGAVDNVADDAATARAATFLNDLAENLTGKRIGLDKALSGGAQGNALLNIMRGISVTNTMSTQIGNPRSIITQLASIPGIIGNVGTSEFLAAALKEIPFLKTAKEDLGHHLFNAYDKKAPPKQMTSRSERALMAAFSPASHIERALARTMYRAAKETLSKRGVPEAVARDISERNVKTWMARTISDRPLNSRSVSFRAVNQFLEEQIAQFYDMTEGLGRNIAMGKSNKAQAAAKMLEYAASAYIVGELLRGTVGSSPIPDPVDAVRDIAYNYGHEGETPTSYAFGRLGGDFIAGVPYAGAMTAVFNAATRGSLQSSAVGKGLFEGVVDSATQYQSGTPATRPIAEATKPMFSYFKTGSLAEAGKTAARSALRVAPAGVMVDRIGSAGANYFNVKNNGAFRPQGTNENRSYSERLDVVREILGGFNNTDWARQQEYAKKLSRRRASPDLATNIYWNMRDGGKQVR